MDKEATQRLLNIVSTLDNRQVTEAMIESWSAVMTGTTFEDAMERVGKFYRSGNTRRLAVQDVVTPDEQPDDTAWMNRSKERPTAGVRYYQLRTYLKYADAIEELKKEGYDVSTLTDLEALHHVEPTS